MVFSVWCLGNCQKLLTTDQFLVSTMLFTNINIYFFNLRFDRFSIIAKKSQSNQEQYSLCCSSPCFCVLLCTHYGAKEIGVLRLLFPDYVISFDYAAIYKNGDKGNIKNYRPISFLNLYYEIYTITLKGYLRYKNVFAIK